MAAEALVVFAREPVPGRVKTRLAKDIGAESACRVYRYLLGLTLAAAREVEATRYLYLPEGEVDSGPGFEQRRQVGLDLGSRMSNAFLECFSEGFARVVLIGSDCPAISTTILGKAFSALEQHQAVFGPAHDGGYYLVGQTAPGHDLFSDIPWSNPQTWELTRQLLKDRGWSYATLEVLEDIDDLESLRRYHNETPETGLNPQLLENILNSNKL